MLSHLLGQTNNRYGLSYSESNTAPIRHNADIEGISNNMKILRRYSGRRLNLAIAFCVTACALELLILKCLSTKWPNLESVDLLLTCSCCLAPCSGCLAPCSCCPHLPHVYKMAPRASLNRQSSHLNCPVNWVPNFGFKYWPLEVKAYRGWPWWTAVHRYNLRDIILFVALLLLFWSFIYITKLSLSFQWLYHRL